MAVDRDWFIAAAFRVKAAADELWQQVRRFHTELLRLEGRPLPEELAFDREYFRRRMAEARQRGREERMRRIGELLASQSGPLMMEEPVRLDTVPGLTDALDGFVSSPIPVELLKRFAARSDFDLDDYQHHILAHIGWSATSFDQIPPLLDNRRRDLVFRFIAAICLAHGRQIELWEDSGHIRVRKRDAYEQGQGISKRAAQTA
jgi:hypothetical protein